MDIYDYLIDQKDHNWSELLAPWHDKLPREFTLWMVNRFGDLFIVLDDKTVWSLRMDEGNVERQADSREHFRELIDQDNNANEWLLIPLVDQLVAAGIKLGPGECYGFTVPPVVGGEYSLKNIRCKELRDYYVFLADFYRQIADVPDGTPISLEITRSD